MIIKIILIIILLLILYLTLNSNSNKEHFHELTKQTITTNVVKQCGDAPTEPASDSPNPNCYKKDFTYSKIHEKCKGETKFILGRCVKQHTKDDGSGQFKESDECPDHNILSKDSGCKKLVNTYWSNINTLYDLSKPESDDDTSEDTSEDTSAKKCACRNELEPDTDAPSGYSKWVGLID